MVTRKLGLIAAAVAVGTALAYVVLISSEGERKDIGVAVFVTALIGGAGAAAWVGAVTPDLAKKRILLGAATGALLSMGILAIFSIGLLLLVAGIVSAVAWVRGMVAQGGASRLTAVGAFLAAAAAPFLLLLPI